LQKRKINQIKMQKLFVMMVLCFAIAACSNTKVAQKGKTEHIGAKINAKNAISVGELAATLGDKNMVSGITMKGEIASCCAKKGCWMKLTNPNGEEVRVTFKDYAFFVPLNSAGRTATVRGTAFAKEISVDDLRHYAEDAGKSQDEIMAITEPKKELTFEAEGVILQ
jgi:hypothetical protein